MQHRLSPSTIALLTLPPLLWAGNAVVGRLVHGLVPPMTLNPLRWLLAFACCCRWPAACCAATAPVAHWALQPAGPAGVGCYNALQYLALQTSTPINVTWWARACRCGCWRGALFFGVPVARRQLLGALLSIVGVVLVLSRGEWAQLMAALVPGDLFMLLATIAWAFYSWLLVRTAEPPACAGTGPAF
jgi:drug/metabolite transporter (DMT)-like permease